jgi:hypothetical protein
MDDQQQRDHVEVWLLRSWQWEASATSQRRRAGGAYGGGRASRSLSACFSRSASRSASRTVIVCSMSSGCSRACSSVWSAPASFGDPAIDGGIAGGHDVPVAVAEALQVHREPVVGADPREALQALGVLDAGGELVGDVAGVGGRLSVLACCELAWIGRVNPPVGFSVRARALWWKGFVDATTYRQ